MRCPAWCEDAESTASAPVPILPSARFYPVTSTMSIELIPQASRDHKRAEGGVDQVGGNNETWREKQTLMSEGAGVSDHCDEDLAARCSSSIQRRRRLAAPGFGQHPCAKIEPPNNDRRAAPGSRQQFGAFAERW